MQEPSGSTFVPRSGARRPLSLRALGELAEQQGVHPGQEDLEVVLGPLNDLLFDLAKIENELLDGVLAQ